MHALTLLASALLLIPSAVGAAPQTKWNPKAPENAQLLSAFSPDTVEPVLAAIGARFQRAGTAERPQLFVFFPNGRRATLVMSSCSGEGCKALSIQAYWTPLANAAPGETARAIERYNRRYAFAKAFVAADGRPALHRYLTADYGFVRGNLAVNLLVFAEQADTFAREVLQPLGREQGPARPERSRGA